MKAYLTCSAAVLVCSCMTPAAWAQSAGDGEVVTPDAEVDEAEPEQDAAVGSRAPSAPPAAASPRSDRREPTPAAPASSERWWESYRPMPDSNLRVPLLATGGGLTGLGLFAMIAGGITWLTAYGHSRDLDDECPGGLCVEGTDGGDSYKSTRDLSRAAAITVGVGFPVMITGVVLMGIGGSAGQRSGSFSAAPIITAQQQGAAMEVRF